MPTSYCIKKDLTFDYLRQGSDTLRAHVTVAALVAGRPREAAQRVRIAAAGALFARRGGRATMVFQ
jgi:hypothetical protein